MDRFRMILLMIFGGLGLIGLILFISIKPPTSLEDSITDINMWGTVPIDRSFFSEHHTLSKVHYRYIPIKNFNNTLINSLANGNTPDLILFPQSIFYQVGPRLEPILNEELSQRDFLDTFQDGSDILWRKGTAWAYPIFSDPLVMYWNKDILTQSKYLFAPKTWSEVLFMAPRLTILDNKTHKINRSAIALGTFSNIKYAKDIISLLLLQSGEKIVSLNADEKLSVPILERSHISESNAFRVFDFFTSFSDIRKDNYSWNKAFKNSLEEFSAENLALYIGKSSDLEKIREKNPNLNFDVAVVPQSSNFKITTGEIYSVGLMKASRNKPSANYLRTQLLRKDISDILVKEVKLVPVRKDSLSEKPKGDAIKSVFYDSAFFIKTWHDPNPMNTESIFRDAINDYISGKRDLKEVVEQVFVRIGSLLK